MTKDCLSRDKNNDDVHVKQTYFKPPYVVSEMLCQTFFENYTNSKINFEIKIINSRSYPRDKSVLKDIDEELLRQCWDVYNQA
jgi:hypothetical protein